MSRVLEEFRHQQPPALRRRWQRGGAVTRVGYAPGVFDLFHVGHLNILRHAKLKCDVLIAGVVSDAKSLSTKGVTPVVPLVERVEIVGAIKYVDRVVVESHDEKLDVWREVGFDVIFKGDDWRGTPKGDKLERDFAAVGVEVAYVPYTMHTSSTMLRKMLAARTFSAAESGQSASL